MLHEVLLADTCQNLQGAGPGIDIQGREHRTPQAETLSTLSPKV